MPSMAGIYPGHLLGTGHADPCFVRKDLGFDNVHVVHSDGTLGWPEHAPYDAILVSAGGPLVPPWQLP